MHTAFALLAIGLAVIFALSGVGKLRAPARSEATLTALRLPTRAARVTVRALAIFELIVAVALMLPRPLSTLASGAAALLTAGFVIVVARAFRLGSREDCGCFGDGGTPISVRLIIRNAVLLAAALVATALSWSGAEGVAVVASALPDDPTSALTVLAAALLAIVAWLSYPASSASTAQIATPDAAASTDDTHPHIVAIEQRTGVPRDLSAAAERRSQLLVFVKPGCGSCIEVKGELDQRAGVLGPILTASLIVSAPADRAPEQHDDERYLLDPADHNARVIGIGSRRPVAALLATDGTIVQPLAHGKDEIFDLLDVLEQAALSQ